MLLPLLTVQTLNYLVFGGIKMKASFTVANHEMILGGQNTTWPALFAFRENKSLQRLSLLMR